MSKIFTKQMLILGVVTFLYMFSISMTNPVIAGLCALLGGSGLAMGVVGGLSSFVSLFCRPFLGSLIDRNDRRKLGLIGLAFMWFGGMICGLSPNVWLLLVGRLAVGVGLAISSSTFSTWVATSLPPDQIGQGMGLYGVIQALSMAIAPALGLWVADLVSSRLTCLISAAMNMISILMVLPLTDEHYIKAAERNRTNSFEGKQIFIPRLLPVALLMFLFCVPYNGTMAFLETSIIDRGLDFSAGPCYSLAGNPAYPQSISRCIPVPPFCLDVYTVWRFINAVSPVDAWDWNDDRFCYFFDIFLWHYSTSQPGGGDSVCFGGTAWHRKLYILHRYGSWNGVWPDDCGGSISITGEQCAFLCDGSLSSTCNTGFPMLPYVA